MPVNDLATLTRDLTRADDVFLAPIDRIEVSPFQAREFFDDDRLEELAADIEENGVLHPILLRPHPRRQGWFQLVAGERRWRATKLRFGETIRATVRDWNDIQAAQIGLAENLKDESLTDFEEAKGIRSLWEMYAKQGAEYNDTQFARIIKKSVTFITNCWKLLKLDPDLLELAKTKRGVKTNLITISTVKDPVRRGIYKEKIKEGISVEKLGEMILEDEARIERERVASKGPDAQTEERRNAEARGENPSMSRGKRVTKPKGPSRAEMRTQVLQLQAQYLEAAQKLNDEDWFELVEPFARRILRQDLSR